MINGRPTINLSNRFLSHHCACPTNIGMHQQHDFQTYLRSHVQHHDSLLDAIRAVTGMYSVHRGLPGSDGLKPACSCITLNGDRIAHTVEHVTEPELTVAVTFRSRRIWDNDINIRANTPEIALLIYRTLSNAALHNPYNTMISSCWTIRLGDRYSEAESELMGDCVHLVRHGDGPYDVSRDGKYCSFQPEHVAPVPL